MADKNQLPLFPQRGVKGQYGPPLAQIKSIDSNSSLAAAASAYHDHMLRQGFSEHTVKAFAGDLRLLQKYFGPNHVVSKLGTKDLNDFLTWLLHYRGVPCSPKSYGRRVTTLKNFFGWLASTKTLAFDPAAPLVHARAKAPLPSFLKDDEVEKLLDAAEKRLNGSKSDPRPYLLAHLVLQTGIKKSECVGLALRDIDRSGPEPSILIRYSNPRMQHKERKLSFATELLPVMDQYLEKYKPNENLFECTPRNLEYVLADISEAAGLPNQVSFEMLRWTSAVRDYRDGMDHEHLRQKMGLSKITWRETAEKLDKLAGPGL
ncbi:MAG TPA: tyrosine-type recombinase/integrase [Anaerolineae bacterium]|nr:tyrosine-type recombinase/integrase [Anaerolineae bacterium]